MLLSPSPNRKNNKLTQALNNLRLQTARQAQTMGARNDVFRTVASTPKSRKFSFATAELSESLNNPNGLTSIAFKQVDVKPRLLETKITED